MARTTIQVDVISNDKVAVKKENNDTLKKTTIERVENIIILAYSLKKMSTNPIDAYSTLKPETSSDSPSAKSKGVRLVSASRSTTQIKAVRGTNLNATVELAK